DGIRDRNVTGVQTCALPILQDYRDVLDLSGADAYDPSGLITSAADLWEANPKAAAAESARIQYVVIDDFQDATPAIHRLVQLIRSEERRVGKEWAYRW